MSTVNLDTLINTLMMNGLIRKKGKYYELSDEAIKIAQYRYSTKLMSAIFPAKDMKCPVCGKKHANYPYTHTEMRELFISFTCPDCQKVLFDSGY